MSYLTYSNKHIIGGLYNYERFWCDNQKWLEAQGYLLRPRYRADWVPSWTSTESFTCKEDSASYIDPNVMDATRMSDGQVVMLKKVSKLDYPHEVAISLYFSCPPLAADPRNHCVPIYTVLQVPTEPNTELLVTPLLRAHSDPPFDTVGEVVEFFRQVFEGVQFMHRHHVAHRDCTFLNIMMDATSMYPNGYHPSRPWKTRDSKHVAKYHTRTKRPPKYYLGNLSLSRLYDESAMPPLEPIIRGTDKSAPEHSPDSHFECNPFPTDIYHIGNMIKTRYLEASDPPKHGLEFMIPLVRDMIHNDPFMRPTIDEVVIRFDDLWRQLSTSQLRARTQYSGWEDDSFPAFHHYLRRLSFSVRNIQPVPAKTAIMEYPRLNMSSPSFDMFGKQVRVSIHERSPKKPTNASAASVTPAECNFGTPAYGKPPSDAKFKSSQKHHQKASHNSSDGKPKVSYPSAQPSYRHKKTYISTHGAKSHQSKRYSLPVTNEDLSGIEFVTKARANSKYFPHRPTAKDVPQPF